MEGLTQVSVLILVGVCLAAIPMAVAVKALERLHPARGFSGHCRVGGEYAYR